ncbi:hypothetical protein [Christiangramia salexigens]|uniref:NlpE C-terminal OB domain-containing protein n=1 Tax=Christiangramia salexigens TaxID=1913577 RepID=A0A1L3J722_9FLAO|nr:hypothetical protein [Christiangramia salexigens]APG60936.1 hypothetical protein LPB144_11180 [Christiangramia salexigens]
MKKLFGIFIIALSLFACQDEDRKELMSQPEVEKVPDSIQVLKGDFVYGTDAAVIRGGNFVYGVSMDSMAKVLAKKVAPLKSNDFQMIPVTVKAKVIPNLDRDGWEEVIEIREIIEVPETGKVSDTINKK